MANNFHFSIIIPTLNAGPQFERLLNCLFEQHGATSDLIVVDSGSNDSTLMFAMQKKATVIEIGKKEFDHGGTRNLGAKAASGEILLFITQDILPADKDLLSAFSTVFQDESIGGAYARQIPRQGALPLEALSRRYSYPETSRTNTYDDLLTKGVQALYFANPCACVRRSVFEEVGGFPDKIICNEDMAIAHKILKAGYKTAYVPTAIVHHSHSYSPVQLFHRYFDIGTFFMSYPELRSKAKNTNEGFWQTIRMIKVLFEQKAFVWIPLLFIETAVKLLGYKAGERYKILPNAVRKACSMNKTFWDKNHQ